MKLSDEKIDELAHLARLEFGPDQKAAIRSDLDKIIAFCDKLREMNTDGVEPLIYLSDEKNVLREDVVNQPDIKEQALKNAPKHDSDYFKVPKVIKK